MAALAKNSAVQDTAAKTPKDIAVDEEELLMTTAKALHIAENNKLVNLENQLLNGSDSATVNIKISNVKVVHSSAADFLSLVKQSPEMLAELKVVDPPSAPKYQLILNRHVEKPGVGQMQELLNA